MRARGALAARIAFGVLAAVAGLVFGVLGSLLLGIWLFTPHEVVYRNHNILLMAPFALALLPLGLAVAAGARRARRPLLQVARAAVVLAVLGVLIKVIPGVRQDNGALVALMLPLWLGLALGARGLGGVLN